MSKKENKQFEKEIDFLINLLKVISVKNRLKILYFLKNRKMSVCKISQFLNLPQNLVSHHLKVLKQVNLVHCQRVGTKIFYELDKSKINFYRKLLKNIFN